MSDEKKSECASIKRIIPISIVRNPLYNQKIPKNLVFNGKTSSTKKITIDPNKYKRRKFSKKILISFRNCSFLHNASIEASKSVKIYGNFGLIPGVAKLFSKKTSCRKNCKKIKK